MHRSVGQHEPPAAVVSPGTQFQPDFVVVMVPLLHFQAQCDDFVTALDFLDGFNVRVRSVLLK